MRTPFITVYTLTGASKANWKRDTRGATRILNENVRYGILWGGGGGGGGAHAFTLETE